MCLRAEIQQQITYLFYFTFYTMGSISPNFFLPSKKLPAHSVRQKKCHSISPTTPMSL